MMPLPHVLAGIALSEAKRRMQDQSLKLTACMKRIKSVQTACRLFGERVPSFAVLKPIEAELVLLASVFALFSEVDLASDRFWKTPFKEVRFESVSEEVLSFSRAIRALPSGAHELPVYRELLRRIDTFSALLPLLTALGHQTVQLRHWRALEAGMGVSLPVSTARLSDGTFPLRSLIKVPLLRHRALIDSICVGARKEAEVRRCCSCVAMLLPQALHVHTE